MESNPDKLLLWRALFVLKATWSTPGVSIGALIREIEVHLPCSTCGKRGCGGDCARRPAKLRVMK